MLHRQARDTAAASSCGCDCDCTQSQMVIQRSDRFTSRLVKRRIGEGGFTAGSQRGRESCLYFPAFSVLRDQTLTRILCFFFCFLRLVQQTQRPPSMGTCTCSQTAPCQRQQASWPRQWQRPALRWGPFADPAWAGWAPQSLAAPPGDPRAAAARP